MGDLQLNILEKSFQIPKKAPGNWSFDFAQDKTLSKSYQEQGRSKVQLLDAFVSNFYFILKEQLYYTKNGERSQAL
ncbi:MAG: hypothetical protein A2Z24_01920 [Candidatus Woykebacteria bacterium RBG_16_44_10]|uniref:Uncharacterized protein n=1 Tax=Candidatus Woykebacteria bacterium RBG_16_44_10 TaxID=1802597 RepID=A0A1G1WEK5_9BACT|nr:MAG: hypothetical protein A2Z24_01920 [Candidatus Woykebacteria bacterium RBG_16_44_10]